MIIDPHIHLLPEFGDGPSDDDEAAKMLLALDAAGVSIAVCVTHVDLLRMQERTLFSHRVHSAQNRLKSLQKRVKSRVQLLYSFELDYETGLFQNYDMSAYRVPETDLLSVNFPLGNFSDEDMQDFSCLIHRQHLRPLICQFERHILMAGNAAEKLLGIYAAEYLISSTSLLLPKIDEVLEKSLSRNRPIYLCSNAHNATTRPPLLTAEEMRLSNARQRALLKKLQASNAALYRKIVR